MKSVRYKTIERFTRGHYNPHDNVVVTYKGKSYELQAGQGSRDNVNVYQEGTDFFVLSINRSLGYVALAWFDLKSEPSPMDDHDDPSAAGWTPRSEMYVGRDYEITDILGKRGLDLEPRTILRKLMPYVEND